MICYVLKRWEREPEGHIITERLAHCTTEWCSRFTASRTPSFMAHNLILQKHKRKSHRSETEAGRHRLDRNLPVYCGQGSAYLGNIIFFIAA
jgi:hypothetical protein